MTKNKMYEVKGKRMPTWNPFKGCKHDCIYCVPSFKRQAKRQKNRCERCYRFEPHFHPERLNQSLPKYTEIACCINGDIAFSTDEQVQLIFNAIRKHPTNTFLLQSKKPDCFIIDGGIPDNVVIGTTIETNYPSYRLEEPYSIYSKAPEPIRRYYSMNSNRHPRKFVTIEPIMKFNFVLLEWIRDIKPEFVYVGYNNYDSLNLHLPEPSLEDTIKLCKGLDEFTEVRLKTIRKAWDEK